MDWSLLTNHLGVAALAGLALLTLMWKAQARLIDQLMTQNNAQQVQLNVADKKARAARVGWKRRMKALASEHENCRREIAELKRSREANTRDIEEVKQTVEAVVKKVANGETGLSDH